MKLLIQCFYLLYFVDCLFGLERAQKSLSTNPETLGPYFCGTNTASSWGSYFMTLSCDQDSINSCCAVHDTCYSTCALPQRECDDQFCNCLRSLPGSSYCRQLVHSTHCSLVQFLGHNYICAEKAQPAFNPLRSLQAEVKPPLRPPRPFQGPPPVQFNGKSEYMPSPFDQIQPHHMMSFHGDFGDPYQLFFPSASTAFYLSSWLFIVVLIEFF